MDYNTRRKLRRKSNFAHAYYGLHIQDIGRGTDEDTWPRYYVWSYPVATNEKKAANGEHPWCHRDLDNLVQALKVQAAWPKIK